MVLETLRCGAVQIGRTYAAVAFDASVRLRKS